MPEGLVILFVMAMVLFVVAFVVAQHYMEKDRREKFRAVAADLGLAFSPEGDPGLRVPWERLHLFSQGRSRQAYNLMRGSLDGVDVTLFDYRYTTSSGKNSHTHRQTVLLLESARLQLPLFALRPEHLFHKIAGTLGYQDINFGPHPAFSNHYLLRGPDEDGIRTIFGNEVLDAYPRHGDLCTEGAGQQLILYRANRRVSPNLVPAFLREGRDLFELFAAPRRPAGPARQLPVEAEARPVGPQDGDWTDELDHILSDLQKAYPAGDGPETGG